MKLGQLKDFLHELDNLNVDVVILDNGFSYDILDIEVDPDTENVYFIVKND